MKYWNENSIDNICKNGNINGAILEVKLAGSFKCSSADVLNQVISDIGRSVDEDDSEVGGL